MKKLIAIALLTFGMNAFAQEAPKHDGKKRAEMEKLTPEQRNQLHVKKLTLELGLTASQQKEISAILKDAGQKRETAITERKAQKESGKKLTADERFAMKNKMLDEQIAIKEKVRKVLNDEQFAKWEKMHEKEKDHFKERMKDKERPHKK